MKKTGRFFTFLVLLILVVSCLSGVPMPANAAPLQQAGGTVIIGPSGGVWTYISTPSPSTTTSEWYPTSGAYKDWYKPSYDESGWSLNPATGWSKQWDTLGWSVPSGLSKLAYHYSSDANYSIGLHRQWFAIPAGQRATSVKLEIFADDMFTAHLNGVKLFTYGGAHSETFTNIDPSILAEGGNLLAISLLNASGPGGLVYRLTVTYADTVPPTLGFSGAVSNTWYNSNRTITAASTDHYGIAEQYVSDTNGNWRTSFTATQTTDIWCRAKDNNGNWAGPSICGKVLIDKTAPTLGFAGATSGSWYNSNRTITPNSSDSGGSGLSAQYVSDTNGNWRSSITVSSTTTIYCYAKDKAGNEKSGTCGTVNIDKSAPSAGKNPTLNPSSWTNGNVTATVTKGDDTGGSGSKGINCSTTSSVPTTNTTATTCSQTFTSNGTLYYRTVDNAGNWSAVGSVAVTNIDKTAPQSGKNLTLNPSAWTNGNVVATITKGDDTGGSGARGVNCAKTSNVPTTDTTASTCSLTFTENGTFYYRTVDNAGNWSAVGSANITNIDKIPPLPSGAVSSVAPEGWTNQDVIVSVSTDEIEDEPGGVTIFCKTDLESSYTEGGETCAKTFPQNGVFSYYLQDAAGNKSIVQTIAVTTIDKTPPQVAFRYPRYTVSDDSLIITVDIGVDDESGAKGIACAAESGAVSMDDTAAQSCSITVPLTTAAVHLYARTLDNAGNWSSEGIATVHPQLAPAPVQEVNVSQPVQSGVWQNHSNQLTFSWESPDTLAIGYEVYWGTNENATSGVQQTETTFQTPALTDGVPQYLRIKSIGSYGYDSDWQTVFVSLYDTSKPTGITSATEIHGVISSVAQSEIDQPAFVWNPATDVAGILGYQVYFGNNPNGTSTTLVTTPEFTVESPVENTGLYYLRLRSVDNAGNYSDWKLAFIFNYKAAVIPNVSSAREINGLTSDVWQKGVNRPSFVWDVPDENITGYRVYFGTNPNGTSDYFTSQTAYSPSEPVTNTGTYYLRVQSVLSSGKHSEWNTVFVFKYDISRPDPVAYPITELTGSQPNICQSVTRSPHFVWGKPADVGSGVAGYKYLWTKDPNEINEEKAAFIGGESLVLDNIDGGIHFLLQKAFDYTGNESDWTITYDFCYALAEGYVFPTEDTEITATLPDSNNQVTLQLPAGMHDDPLKIMVYDGTANTPPVADFRMLGTSFGLEAISATTNENIKNFNKPYTIRVTYTDEDVADIDPTTLKIYYRNPETGEWEALPTSTVDTVNRVVTATIDHMSEYGVMGLRQTENSYAVVNVQGQSTFNIEAAPVDFGTVNLNGEPKYLEVDSPGWTAIDPTGLGNGWTLQVAASDFVSGERSLPVSNLSILLDNTTVQVVAGNDSPASLVENWTALNYIPLPVLTAQNGKGMGTYTFTPRFSLYLPASTYAGEYHATITVTMIAGGQ